STLLMSGAGRRAAPAPRPSSTLLFLKLKRPKHFYPPCRSIFGRSQFFLKLKKQRHICKAVTIYFRKKPNRFWTHVPSRGGHRRWLQFSSHRPGGPFHLIFC